ncbi:hypothetical protein DFJ74DRAFT_662355 [Hyaloraphidium curvatum]|nr:hypothetical protein DFJ74DRAFT_662355 [Hyaloraphidium curvatum]
MASAPVDERDAFGSFSSSFLVILVSEIGDKTFLINAIMAMRHPRAVVFAGAMGALAVMSVLSSALGYTLPALLSRNVTQWLAAGLFLVFGAKMVKEAQAMSGDEVQHEMEEVTQQILDEEEAEKADKLESGGGAPPSGRTLRDLGPAIRNLLQYMLSPTFVQTFILTFIAEWGDRSQISTIVLAAAKNPYWVTVGAIAGHAICTGGAVLGGKMIASRISVKTVTFVGAALFIAFGLFTVAERLELFGLSS